MKPKIPLWVHMTFLTVTVLAATPAFLIARARYNRSPEPRVHPIPDMDNQPNYRPQAVNTAFADGRAMRLPVAGTVARGELRGDDHLYRGRVGDQWATTYPTQVAVDMRLMERGRQRYGIYCAPCHGLSGYGDGMVALRADQAGARKHGWTDPASLHKTGEGSPTEQTVGQLFNTITHGKNTMSGYAAQIPVHDRWAIVAYVRALQESQNAD